MSNQSYDAKYADAWDKPVVSTGFMDDWAGTVRNSEFGINPEYNEGKTLQLMWEVEVVENPDPDVAVETGDTINQTMNVGPSEEWDIIDGGASIEKVNGSAPKPKASTDYGKFLAAVQGGHYGDEGRTRLANAEALVDVLRTRGMQNQADIWNGFTFRYGRLKFSYPDKSNKGQLIEYNRTLPVEYLGLDVSPDSLGDTGTSSANGEVTREALEALAAEHKSHSSFLAAALTQYPGVDSGEFAEEVMNAKSGIYAKAHGK